MILEKDLAYIAGFFDGEGCISIGSTSGKSRARVYNIQCCISNTNYQVLFWINTTLKLGVIRTKQVYGINNKQIYQLDFITSQIELFLTLIRLYVKIKKSQLEIALEFLETFKIKEYRVSDNILFKRELYYQEIKELNKRGI